MTGASGFLGSHLTRRLLHEGHRVAALKRTASNLSRLEDCASQMRFYDIESELNKCFDEFAPEVVIHCATDYGRRHVERLSVIESNFVLPLKLLDLSQKYNVRYFINTDTYLDKGINHYSLSKKQFIDWLKTYSTDMVCVNMVLEHFYGPMDDKTKFVSFVLSQLLENKEAIDLTPGEQKRDFTYVDDVVNAFMCVVSHSGQLSRGFHSYGIGTNEQVSIKDVVNLLKELTNNTVTKTNFGAISYRDNEVMNSEIDTASIRNLGWKPEYSLQKGLEKMISLEKKYTL